MRRRQFLSVIGSGALAGLTVRPEAALASVSDVSRPSRKFPTLYGTREFLVGDTVEKLPRARAATVPLDDETAMRFARTLYQLVPASTAGGHHWSKILDAAASMDPMDRMQLVNRFTNRMPYVEDMENYGMSDFWADTGTFFQIGGDCEDFAMAKYKLLNRLGFHADRLRIVLVVDEVRRRQHAVLAVNLDGTAWVLDSVSRRIVPHEEFSQYRPTVSVSGPRLYLHVPPKV